jgi:hypothetical protein
MAETWSIIGRGARTGVIAGVVGTAAMLVSEKIEQKITGRPNSYIPAHTTERFLGLPTKPDRERSWMNQAAHWSLGILPAALRGIMAEGGMRGPLASLMFFATRLTTDETMENVAGVGKPPWSWPAHIVLPGIMHKAVYAFATGAVADKLASTPPPLAERTGGHGPGGSF